MSATLESLMEAYADGDIAAFELLHQSMAPRVQAFLRRAGAPPEQAAELTQQTFLRLHLARGRYRRGEPVKPWIFRIASNLLIDERRRRSQRLEQALEDEHLERLAVPEPDPGISSELSEALQRALDGLPAPQRQVVMLHKYEGLPLQEVADLTGCSLAAAKVRAFRAYEALRRALMGGRV